MEFVLKQAQRNPDISYSEDYERIVGEIIKNPFDFKLEKGLQSLLYLMPMQVGERIVNDSKLLNKTLRLHLATMYYK
jgi:hypothetical protein